MGRHRQTKLYTDKINIDQLNCSCGEIERCQIHLLYMTFHQRRQKVAPITGLIIGDEAYSSFPKGRCLTISLDSIHLSLNQRHTAAPLSAMFGALNLEQEVKVVSQGICWEFNAIWHTALLIKLSTHGRQDRLYSWLSDFLHSRRQCVPTSTNSFLSFPLQWKLECFKAVC